MAIGPTADVDAVVECFCNFRIHVNQQVLLLSQLFVAIGNLFLDPGTEWLSCKRIGHVD